MDKRRVALGVVAVAMLATGCSSDRSDPSAGPAPETTVEEPVVGAGTFASGPCPEGVVATAPVTVSCGTLVVPERHGSDGGPTVELPVAVLQPPGGPTSDPVVYLDGGPGGDGVGQAESLSELPIAGSRTIVVVGQRGSPLATPSFDCPEVEAADTGSYATALGTPDQLSASEQATSACFARVRSGSPAFDTYDTATAADDLEAARQALGYERWNLYGVSYGTRLGLEVLRRHPGPVRSAVLDSVYPAEVESYASLAPGGERAFRQLAEGCDADPGCAAAYPDLYQRIGMLYEQLEETPVDVTVPHPVDGRPTTVRWDGDRTVQAAFQALYSAQIIPLLPFLLRSFEQGDFSLATTTYLELTESGADAVAEGLYLSVECRERAPFADEGELDQQQEEVPPWLLSATEGSSSLDDCRRWTVPPADESSGEPVRSDVPSLVTAGRYDPITPPAWSKQVADTLEQSWFYEFPGYGHGPSNEACAEDMVVAFIEDPASDPVLPCFADLGPPAWVLPS